MVVPVPRVSGVPVPIMHVVGVALVRDRHVAAVRTVLVSVPLLGRVPARLALVDMAFVDTVDVTVVSVIGVVVVRERDVAAALAVDVLMAGVRGVLDGIWHGCSPP